MRISQKITNVIKRGMRPVDCRYIAAIALWRLVEISRLAPIEYPPELLIGVLSLWLIETFDEGFAEHSSLNNLIVRHPLERWVDTRDFCWQWKPLGNFWVHN
jgi:hypothetical protein